MRSILVLSVAAALVSAVCAECGACIEGQCYRKHRLPVSGGSNALIGISRNTNTLYVIKGNKIAQCQLDTHMCNETAYTWNKLETFSVNQRSGEIYGVMNDETGINSIHKLDFAKNNKEFLVHRDVYGIIFKDKIYYTLISKGIFTFEDGESQIVAGTEEYYVYNFIVDHKDDIYFKSFFNNEYVIRRLSKGVVDLTVYWDGNNYHMTVDRDGNAVFIHDKTQAVYRVTDGQLTEIGGIDDSIYIYYVFDAPLFDRDNNLVYKNNPLHYYHLKRDRDVLCTTDISQNRTIIKETVAITENNNKNDSASTTPTLETTTNSSPDGNMKDNYDMFPSTTIPTISSPDGNMKDNDDMFPSTTIPTSSLPGDSGASPSEAPAQQSHLACPKLPNMSISIKVEFSSLCH